MGHFLEVVMPDSVCSRAGYPSVYCVDCVHSKALEAFQAFECWTGASFRLLLGIIGLHVANTLMELMCTIWLKLMSASHQFMKLPVLQCLCKMVLAQPYYLVEQLTSNMLNVKCALKLSCGLCVWHQLFYRYIDWLLIKFHFEALKELHSA